MKNVYEKNNKKDMSKAIKTLSYLFLKVLFYFIVLLMWGLQNKLMLDLMNRSLQ